MNVSFYYGVESLLLSMESVHLGRSNPVVHTFSRDFPLSNHPFHVNQFNAEGRGESDSERVDGEK